MMGGPSVQQFSLSAGAHVTPVVDYDRYDWDGPGSGAGRSIGSFSARLPDPFMDTLDSADASQLTPVRNESATALQALALLNNAFVLRQSEHLASRLEDTSGSIESHVRAAFSVTLVDLPMKRNRGTGQSYARSHGLPSVCRLLFNLNEFLFIN